MLATDTALTSKVFGTEINLSRPFNRAFRSVEPHTREKTSIRKLSELARGGLHKVGKIFLAIKTIVEGQPQDKGTKLLQTDDVNYPSHLTFFDRKLCVGWCV